MCHETITLSACGHPSRVVPDPCKRIVTTNFCSGLVREVDILEEPCDTCKGNMDKLREMSGKNKRREDGKEDSGEIKKETKKLYTDDAYEKLRKECYKRAWAGCFEGGK